MTFKQTYAQFLAIPNGQRIFNYGFDQCVALANQYHQGVLGGSFVPVASAYQWWTGNYSQINAIYTRSSKPVAGAIFVARYGIYNGPHGHIGVVTSVNSNGTFNTMEQNAGTWRYVGRYTRGMANVLGFLVPKNNPASPKLAAHQRRSGAHPVKRRSGPGTNYAEKQPILAPNTVADFNGWIRGQHVNDGVKSTNIWYRGLHSGDWFWAGGFTSQSTSGLKDLNPVATPKPAANQRQVDPTPVNVRREPSSGSALVSSLAANAIITPEGWVRGQSVQNINIWYKVSGGYAWAGGFTVEDASGLKDLNPTTPTPKPEPKPEPTDPTGPDPSTVLGSPGSVLATIDNWDESAPPFTRSFPRPEGATVVPKLPNSILERTVEPNGGFNVGREGAPTHIVLHHAVTENLQAAINTLDGPNAPTTNYVVKDNEIVAMVSERDTPATNGRWRSNQYSVTVEVCNDVTREGKPSPESHETTAWIVARAAIRWGMKLPLARLETVFGHKEVSKSATSCPGELDLEWITNRANEIIEAWEHDSTDPNPGPDPSGELSDQIATLTGMVQWLIDAFKRIFRID